MNELLAALVQLGIIPASTAERIRRNMNPVEAQAWAEAVLGEAFAGALGAQEGRLLDLLRTTQGMPTTAQLDAFWRRENDALWRAVQPTIEAVAQERAIVAALGGTADDAMWNAINDAVIGWVNDYYTTSTWSLSAASRISTQRDAPSLPVRLSTGSEENWKRPATPMGCRN